MKWVKIKTIYYDNVNGGVTLTFDYPYTNSVQEGKTKIMPKALRFYQAKYKWFIEFNTNLEIYVVKTFIKYKESEKFEKPFETFKILDIRRIEK